MFSHMEEIPVLKSNINSIVAVLEILLGMKQCMYIGLFFVFGRCA